MKTNLAFAIHKRQFSALLIFGITIVIVKTILLFHQHQNDTSFPEIDFAPRVTENILITKFNPNDLDENQWKKLGFSEKQIVTILKYKEIVGGTFSSKDQFKKCYAISEEKYNQLEPYILLKSDDKYFFNKNLSSKKLNISGRFNPDKLSQENWQQMGFSEKQATAILKYKNYLGGSFVSKEKLKDCFIINDEQFSQMQVYLILPDKTPENFQSFARTSSSTKQAPYKKFDPNILNSEGWTAMGFSKKQAETIVNYRDKNLKGSFRTLEDVKACYVSSEEKFNEIKAFIVINTDNPKATVNYTDKHLSVTKDQTDFTSIELNKISFRQLIEFGFDEKAAGSYIGFRKKLGGFVNRQQILDTYHIDKELAQKLINTCKFSIDDIQKYSLITAPEEWLKNHPYFKYSADKIIFYRISNPDDNKIWKYLKLKPEYETKMRWYIK